MATEKKEKGSINLKKGVEKSYAKKVAQTTSEDAEYWLKKFDDLAKQQEELRQFVKSNIQRLKYAFKMGFDATGSVTYADIDYNLDLLPRMIDHKFFKEEKEQD